LNQFTSLITLRLQPAAWLSAWREETGHIHLPVSAAPKVKQAVALRVLLAGPLVGATVTGSVLDVKREEALHRIEIEPDHQSLRAVSLLTAAARGEPVNYRERPLRFMTRLPVVVACNGVVSYMTAISISEGGCALRWSGALPPVGQELELRFGMGSVPARLRGAVRWARPDPPMVGVSFGSKGGAAWASLLAEAVKAGAPGV
jgi:PilZ domain